MGNLRTKTRRSLRRLSQPEKPKEDWEAELRKDIASFTKDPLRFVIYSFPWGEGELEGYDGPDKWQRDVLIDLGKGLITINDVVRLATASGHGIGKSALVSWVILWAMSTFEDTKGVVTANTKTQLETKTWSELAKWYRLFIAKHWFSFTATALYSVQPEHEKTWRIDMVPWSEEKTEAFAGLHNKGKRILIIFDEASAISDKIWEVTEGALTDKDTEIIWAVFGNPTRTEGRFHGCFHAMRHRWTTRQIDSRTCKMTNHDQIAKWVVDYGEDSDFVRVRVRGEFPSSSEHQFISLTIVDNARRTKLRPEQYEFAPKILGLDNCWTGSDEGCIFMRQGLYSKMLATFKKNDNDMEIAGLLARFEDEERADGVAIDLGYGTGVYSAGQSLGRDWMLIPFGGGSPSYGFANMRAHMWNEMKQWLKTGGMIPDDPILATELIGPEAYVATHGRNAGKIILESKEDMKDRGLSSPNRADALALTFSISVLPKFHGVKAETHQVKSDWDPFDDKRQ